MSSRLTDMVQFLYQRQRLFYEFPWEDIPGVPEEFMKRWPDATGDEIRQARTLAVDLFRADALVIHDRNPVPVKPPGWH